MSSGLRFPNELSVPDRGGHGDEFEEIRSEFEPEAGVFRRRNLMRTAPRLFDLVWSFTQAEFSTFDYWWQDTIKGGEQEFDLQLLDDDATLVWYTVQAIDVYSAECSESMEWRVNLRVRAKGESFGTERPALTDELGGAAMVGVLLSYGKLQVTNSLRGAGAVGITGRAKMNVLGLAGVAEVGMYALPKGELEVGA